jgi:hypothetical protein
MYCTYRADTGHGLNKHCAATGQAVREQREHSYNTVIAMHRITSVEICVDFSSTSGYALRQIQIRDNMIRCSRRTISTDHIFTDSERFRIGRSA